MYIEEKKQAFCCECNKLTLHKFKVFGQNENKQYVKRGLLKSLLVSFFDSQVGDYQCTVCGTYLNTPDNLDY